VQPVDVGQQHVGAEVHEGNVAHGRRRRRRRVEPRQLLEQRGVRLERLKDALQVRQDRAEEEGPQLHEPRGEAVLRHHGQLLVDRGHADRHHRPKVVEDNAHAVRLDQLAASATARPPPLPQGQRSVSRRSARRASSRGPVRGAHRTAAFRFSILSCSPSPAKSGSTPARMYGHVSPSGARSPSPKPS